MARIVQPVFTVDDATGWAFSLTPKPKAKLTVGSHLNSNTGEDAVRPESQRWLRGVRVDLNGGSALLDSDPN